MRPDRAVAQGYQVPPFPAEAPYRPSWCDFSDAGPQMCPKARTPDPVGMAGLSIIDDA